LRQKNLESTVRSEVPPNLGSYQVLLVALLSLNFGILFFDRNALSFVMPFVKADLRLTNTQVGLTASALSFAWAVSALFIGADGARPISSAPRLPSRCVHFSVGSRLPFYCFWGRDS